MEDLNIIFDLDNTCICIIKDDLAYEVLQSIEYKKNINRLQERFKRFTLVDPKVGKHNPGDGNLIDCFIIIRPKLLEAIEFFEENVKSVNIWSAGVPKYVHNIKDILFPNNNNMIVFTSIDTSIDKDKTTTKNLNNILPFIKNANLQNTIIVDDKLETGSLNKKNLVLCPEYKLKTLNDCLENDNFFNELVNYIKNLKKIVDIRNVDKNLINICKKNKYK